MAILEASEFTLPVPDSQNEVASSFGGLHSVDGFVEGGIPLQDIPEDESEGVADSAFFAEGIVSE